ncbi:FkbM family methyltransferase [Akkermansiaceae bacterium]|nr:FkbM family methyltransferase [Akkermansiaceae bacterium]
MIRTLIERLARGKVFKRKINVAGKITPLYVSPDAQLKFLKFGCKAFDSDLVQTAERFLNENSNVWDVGANVGVFTFASASVAPQGTVVAIEADIWLASILRKSARLPSYRESDIRVISVAVSDNDGIAKFNVARRGRASNSLEEASGRSQAGGSREIQFVPTLKLDTLLSSMPKPDFIKIDVEGAELMVLKAATTIISEIRPVFYIEVGEEVSTEIMSLFEIYDYIAVSLDGELLKGQCEFNTFFIPMENKKAQHDARVNTAGAP